MWNHWQDLGKVPTKDYRYSPKEDVVRYGP
jgi:hypothetical protein